MAAVERTRFHRLNDSVLGPGLTSEYRDPAGHTVAYMDYHDTDPVASVTVFSPATGKSRQYGFRPVAKAMAIVKRHVAKEGYDMP